VGNPGDAALPHLVIISETGMFHSACLFEYGPDKREWYGFHPRSKGRPAGAGEVDRSDRTSFINHYVRFRVSDQAIGAAVRRIESNYGSATYVLGVKDCVSLTGDVAHACGLRVPYWNVTPYGLVQILRLYNDYTEYDRFPLPWS
jgi:hypothetical protein